MDAAGEPTVEIRNGILTVKGDANSFAYRLKLQ
jgi:hypothetical protein